MPHRFIERHARRAASRKASRIGDRRTAPSRHRPVRRKSTTLRASRISATTVDNLPAALLRNHRLAKFCRRLRIPAAPLLAPGGDPKNPARRLRSGIQCQMFPEADSGHPQALQRDLQAPSPTGDERPAAGHRQGERPAAGPGMRSSIPPIPTSTNRAQSEVSADNAMTIVERRSNGCPQDVDFIHARILPNPHGGTCAYSV
jgi:hypothetical protein